MRSRRKLIASSALVLVSALVTGYLGCGSGNSSPANQMPGIHAASQIQVSGKAQRNGRPLGATAVQSQVLLIARSTPSNGCPEETQHRSRSFVLPITAEGNFTVTLAASDFEPISHPKCPLSAAGDVRIAALRMSATAQSAGSSEERASARQGQALVGSGGDLIAQGLLLDFKPSPPASASRLGQADLRVDEAAAASSITITEEEIAGDSCALREGCVNGPGKRKLLRFDGGIVNVGSGPLEIGDPSEREDADFDSCHQHYHLGGIMSYELRSSDGTVAARGRKQGYCMMDSEPASASVATGTSGDGRYTCDDQGLSPGWTDVYDRSLDCQWIDITGVAPGDYVLRLRVNPDLVLAESDYSNNEADVPVRIAP